MTHARRARRVLAAMACTAVVASAGCRSPFHSFADVARPGAPGAVAAVDRKELPEPTRVVADAPAVPPPATADEPAELAGPVATPLLDAALRRAEAAEESQRAAIREAQAAIRQPAAEPSPGPEAKTSPDAEPQPAPEAAPPAGPVAEPEPTAPAAPAPSGIEIKATVEPAAEATPAPAPEAVEPPDAAPEQPKTDPSVRPASVEVEEEAAEVAPPASATDDDAHTRPTPPAPAAGTDPIPEAPAVMVDPSTPGRRDEGDDAPALTIEAVKLCRKILDFGSYEPLKDRTLRPGRSALVYCELGGLEYRPEGDEFVAKVATRVELVRPSDGEKVWEVADSAIDRRPARRRDVYVGTMITLPDAVAPGEYTLRLYQADATSGRTDSAEIPVTIAR